MDSLISGIIDCVARPSTTDTPVRVIRKSASESPTCISSTPVLTSSESGIYLPGSGGIGGEIEYCGGSIAHDESSEESTSTSHHNNSLGATPAVVDRDLSSSQRSQRSSGSLSRLLMDGVAAASSTIYNTPIKSVLTTEGIITSDDNNARSFCGAYGLDCSTSDVFNTNYSPYGCVGGADDEIASEPPIDAHVVRQFEVAFSTFLYKNPAFTSMSHTTLQKLRARLLKESARNIKVENELRQQLADLRMAKREKELNLQRELLVVTRAKAARESELLIQIEKKRRACTLMFDTNNTKALLSGANGGGDNASSSSLSHASSSTAVAGGVEIQNPLMSPTTPTDIVSGSDSFEEFQREIQKNKMEQAHIMAEIENLKLQIATDEQSVGGGGTP